MAAIASGTNKSLVFNEYGAPLVLENKAIPQTSQGNAVIKVLATYIAPNQKDVINGKHPHMTIPAPVVRGHSGIGRVVAVGSDSTSLQEGQLVIIEPLIRSRTNPDHTILLGSFDGGDEDKRKLASEENWRDGLWAEYCKVPLEICHPINEKRVLGRKEDGGLGYSLPDLVYMIQHLVAYGGLSAIELKAGETVLITPATGHFSGGAVEVASAMGATVIAASRNLTILNKMAEVIPRVRVVQLTGDEEKDTKALLEHGPIDAYLDISPGIATNPTYIKSGMKALKPRGRVAFMGGIPTDVGINYISLMMNNHTIRGVYMFERSDVDTVIKMIESGVLKGGKDAGIETVGEFKLEEWEKALDVAAANAAWGKVAVFIP